MPVLTDRQQEVLDFIYDFIEEKKMSPTVREIGMALGGITTKGVMCHLAALKKMGYIISSPGLSRSIQLTKQTRGIPVVNLEDIDRA